MIADGEVVADGPTADVVVSSPAFAPQVAKVLAPQRVADRRPRSRSRCASRPVAGERAVHAPVAGPAALRARPGRCVRGRHRRVRLAVPRPARLGRTPRTPVTRRWCSCCCCRCSLAVVLAELDRRRHGREGGRACSACWPRSAGAAAARRRAPPASSRCFAADHPRRPGARPRLRLRARRGHAVHRRAAHRRRRAVAAVPDARGRLGRLLRRLPAAGPRPARGRAGSRRTARCRAGVRLGDEPVVLAVRVRRPRQTVVRRRATRSRRTCTALPAVLRDHLAAAGTSAARCCPCWSCCSPGTALLRALRRASQAGRLRRVPCVRAVAG